MALRGKAIYDLENVYNYFPFGLKSSLSIFIMKFSLICLLNDYSILNKLYRFLNNLNFRSRKNTASIYPLLDWSKPGKSIVVSAAGILFVFVVHFLVYCMYRLRVCIFTNVCVRHHDDKDKTRMGMPRTISSLESGQKEHFLNSNTVVELKI